MNHDYTETRRWAEMKIIKTFGKSLWIKIEDSDDYDVTEQGVIFRPTPQQLKRIAKAAYHLDNGVLLS
jgi:hypothetical protein